MMTTTTDNAVGNADLAVLILTHNEEKNIGKCLRSVLPLTRKICIVDSGSTDRTVEIARGLGAEVATHPWITYADQFNWGLDHLPFTAGWVMRLDADEELMPDLIDALQTFLADPPAGVNGVYIRRRVYFLDRWIRYGGYYPTWLLRVFRNGVGRCEALWMDEHIVVSQGTTVRMQHDIIDYNNKDLTFWTDKHNKYANRELLDLLAKETPDPAGRQLAPSVLESQVQSRRWMKHNVYGQAPLFWRAFFYFLYRYIARLGFLDGKEGLIFHFLQGFWYRFLVDAKLFEHRRHQRVAAASSLAKPHEHV